jgi:hypothetical protein
LIKLTVTTPAVVVATLLATIATVITVVVAAATATVATLTVTTTIAAPVTTITIVTTTAIATAAVIVVTVTTIAAAPAVVTITAVTTSTVLMVMAVIALPLITSSLVLGCPLVVLVDLLLGNAVLTESLELQVKEGRGRLEVGVRVLASHADKLKRADQRELLGAGKVHSDRTDGPVEAVLVADDDVLATRAVRVNLGGGVTEGKDQAVGILICDEERGAIAGLAHVRGLDLDELVVDALLLQELLEGSRSFLLANVDKGLDIIVLNVPLCKARNAVDILGSNGDTVVDAADLQSFLRAAVELVQGAEEGLTGLFLSGNRLQQLCGDGGLIRFDHGLAGLSVRLAGAAGAGAFSVCVRRHSMGLM